MSSPHPPLEPASVPSPAGPGRVRRRSAAEAVAAGLLLAGSAGACGAPDLPQPASVTVHDSAGITIVEHGPLDPTRELVDVSGAHPLRPHLVIGVAEGPPEYQLFQVSDVKRLPDGGVVVANGGSRDVRVYRADGTHRATLGGPGRGPSEFRYPARVHVRSGDTVLVQDFLDRVVFTTDGAFVRRYTMDMQAYNGLWEPGGGFSEGGEWLADGSLLAAIYQGEEGPWVPGPPFRPRLTLVRVSADLGRVDTLGMYGGILQQMVDVGGEPGVRPVVLPSGVNTWWSTAASDGTVVVGDNALPRFERFGPDGARTVVRWREEPRAFTLRDLEAFKARLRSAIADENRRAEMERAWARMDVPAHFAFYGRLAAGSDGSVWLSGPEWGGDVTEFRGFSPDGRYLGVVRVPGTFAVYDAGPGWLLGVRRDELGVEFVELYGLAPGGG